MSSPCPLNAEQEAIGTSLQPGRFRSVPGTSFLTLTVSSRTGLWGGYGIPIIGLVQKQVGQMPVRDGLIYVVLRQRKGLDSMTSQDPDISRTLMMKGPLLKTGLCCWQLLQQCHPYEWDSGRDCHMTGPGRGRRKTSGSGTV